MPKPANLEEATEVLWRAAEIRAAEEQTIGPDGLNTEESVIDALREYGASPIEIIQERDKYTRALRIMRRLTKN